MDKHYIYKTKNVCAQEISFDLVDGRIFNVHFQGGCKGNTQGMAVMVDGIEAHSAIRRLKGILCRNGTSCPDQLATAIEQCLKSMGEEV